MIERLAPAWRVLQQDAADGATNMAVDAALLARAKRSGEGVLRLYAWSRPTLSFGRNERASGRFDPARLLESGIGAVRRPTGGRVLLHHRELTYSVTAPSGALTLGESYRAINALLLAALARLGVAAAEAGRSRTVLRPDGAACFAAPAPGELVVGGAKLVGSAQLREGGALLQHGSILLDDDQGMIAALRVAGDPHRTIAPVATLRHALGRPITFAEVARALLETLAATVTPRPLAESDVGAYAPVADLRSRFADPEWTWRR